MRPTNSGQALASPCGKSSVIAGPAGPVEGTGAKSRATSRPSPAAARSRAMPATPKQSLRSGVSLISITGPSRPSALTAGVPTSASGGSSMIPSCSSPSLSSRIEHSMPTLATPRIVAFFKTSPETGMIEPSGANTAFMPVRALGAPQTTSNTPCLVSTVHSRSRSALGCWRASRTKATLKAARSAPGSVTPSTSRPSIVNRSQIAWSEASVARCSLSQGSVNFIATARHRWWGYPRARSRSGAASADRPRRRCAGRECRI